MRPEQVLQNSQPAEARRLLPRSCLVSALLAVLPWRAPITLIADYDRLGVIAEYNTSIYRVKRVPSGSHLGRFGRLARHFPHRGQVRDDARRLIQQDVRELVFLNIVEALDRFDTQGHTALVLAIQAAL